MNKALFLDRDGIINIDYGYVYQKENFEFIDGIFELVKKANESQYKVIIVTNQAGIGRGYYTEQDFWQLMNWVKFEFIRHQATIDDIYFCPYHPKFGIGKYKQESDDRKPNPGMLIKAQKKHDLDMSQSMMIGDKDSDMLAAKAVGIDKRFLLEKHVMKIKDTRMLFFNEIMRQF